MSRSPLSKALPCFNSKYQYLLIKNIVKKKQQLFSTDEANFMLLLYLKE